MNELVEHIGQWDGKSAAAIGAVYDQFGDDPAFAATLVDLCALPPLQKGATWLLKRHLEQGNALDDAQTAQLFAQLGELKHWASQLHVLQSLPYLTIPASQKAAVEAFVRAGLMQRKTFVRAWAYNGLYELAVRYPEYRAEAEEAFVQALQEESASVKARIRRIMKHGF